MLFFSLLIGNHSIAADHGAQPRGRCWSWPWDGSRPDPVNAAADANHERVRGGSSMSLAHRPEAVEKRKGSSPPSPGRSGRSVGAACSASVRPDRPRHSPTAGPNHVGVSPLGPCFSPRLSVNVVVVRRQEGFGVFEPAEAFHW
jgi:hypothetical protein